MISYKRYNYSTDEGDSKEFLELSNSWSRKSINFIIDQNNSGVLWTLKNKAKFSLNDEFGNVITEKDLVEDEKINEVIIQSFDMNLIDWIKETIIKHLDFLVETYQSKKKER